MSYIVNSMFNFLKLQNCSPKQLNYFIFPSALYNGSDFSTSLLTLITIYLFLIITILMGVKWYFSLVFVCVCFPNG